MEEDDVEKTDPWDSYALPNLPEKGAKMYVRTHAVSHMHGKYFPSFRFSPISVLCVGAWLVAHTLGTFVHVVIFTFRII